MPFERMWMILGSQPVCVPGLLLHYKRQGRKAEDLRSRGTRELKEHAIAGTNNRPEALPLLLLFGCNTKNVPGKSKCG